MWPCQTLFSGTERALTTTQGSIKAAHGQWVLGGLGRGHTHPAGRGVLLEQ